MLLKTDKKILNIIVIILIITLLISITPIVVSAFYSHPLFDDFAYSSNVNHVVKSGGNFFEVLSAGLQQVKQYYINWQGTYASIFFFAIQPGAFSDDLYFLTAVIMLISLIFSTIFFTNTVFDSLGYNKKYGLIISLLISILSIQFVIDKYEAFYWWNGCSYYTLFYAFSLVFYSLLIKIYLAEKTGKRICCFVISLLLTILIGGGNYSTALVTMVILALAICVLTLKKDKKAFYFLALFVVLLIGLVISMVAPGNSVRATTVTSSSPFKAIIMSVWYAAVFCAKWTGLAQLACFSIVFIIALVLTKNTKFEFKYPFFVFLFTLAIFATQLTPPLYAMNYIGSGRQLNIYYYSYYLLMTFNIFYLSGWINKRDIINIKVENLRKSHIIAGLIMLIAVFVGGCLNYGINNITFVDTFLALKDGTPQAYSNEYKSIILDIKNGKTEVSDIKTVPDFFAPFYIEPDSSFWTNQQMAKYFEVDEITLKSED